MQLSNLKKLDTLLKIMDDFSNNISLGLTIVEGHFQAITSVHAWYDITKVREKFEEIYPLSEKGELEACLDKLEEDKFITVNWVKYEDQSFYTECKINFNGKVFIEQDGYQGKKRKKEEDQRTNRVIQGTIAVTGAVAGYYYLREIFYSNNGLTDILFFSYLILVFIEVYLVYRWRKLIRLYYKKLKYKIVNFF